MVASNNTIHEMTKVLIKHLGPHLSQREWIELMGALCTIPGNKSFRETLREIAGELKRSGIY